MIDYAKDLHDEYGTDYEVQMLMGVRDDAQRDLAAEGVPMWQYILRRQVVLLLLPARP